MEKIKEEILKLKQEKNAVILAHCYQNSVIDEVADFVGDSLYLSQMAKKSDADLIIFAGVYFMAQTAKIISPDKKVLIPTLNAGCKMADMINLEGLRLFKSKYPNVPVVCYINSTADVKSESDICCTSSNAVQIVKSLNSDKVLFVPDANLADFVSEQLPNVEVISYNGYCPIHKRVKEHDIVEARAKYPKTKILTHPECTREVRNLSDFIGSTSQIMEYVKNTNYGGYIIVTETGVTDRLKRDYPQKSIIPLFDNLVCQDMKRNGLIEIRDCLKNEKFEIKLDNVISEKALIPINRMLEVSYGQ